MYFIKYKSCESGKCFYLSFTSVGIALTPDLKKALCFEDLVEAYAFMVFASYYPDFEVLDFEIVFCDEIL